VIIFVGQIDNFLGVTTPAEESAARKLIGYFHGGWTPDWQTVFVGSLVIAMMVFWPARWGKVLPGSLAGIITASLVTFMAGWDIPAIGAIPRTILLDQRLHFDQIPWSDLRHLMPPVIS